MRCVINQLILLAIYLENIDCLLWA